MEDNLMVTKKKMAEVIEHLIAICKACNETGRVEINRNLITPESKGFNESVPTGLAEWVEPETNKKAHTPVHD